MGVGELIMVSRLAWLVVAAAALSCLNNDGEAVDWYVGLKLPESADGPFVGKTFAVIPT